MQSGDSYPFYVEPGYTTIRKPDGTAQMYGKVVIDMRNGDIWGFPTLTQSPYPIDSAQTKPPKSHPLYWASLCSTRRSISATFHPGRGYTL